LLAAMFPALLRERTSNSGYDGWWTSPTGSRLFNNDYYYYMFSKGWFAESISSSKNQWTRGDTGMPTDGTRQMMLSTDLCLAYKPSRMNTPSSSLYSSSNNCCAWTTPTQDSYIKSALAMDNNFCGYSTSSTAYTTLKSGGGITSFNNMRGACCTKTTNAVGHDCDTMTATPTGQAISAIEA
jgi:hypothetical protein